MGCKYSSELSNLPLGESQATLRTETDGNVNYLEEDDEVNSENEELVALNTKMDIIMHKLDWLQRKAKKSKDHESTRKIKW